MSRFSQNHYSAGGPGNPLVRALGFIVGLIVMTVAVLLGAIFIAALVGLVLIGSAIFAIRLWWLRRKMEKYAREHGDLEAEYVVIEERTRELRSDDDNR